MPKVSDVKLVLFDLVGTLIKPETWPAEELRRYAGLIKKYLDTGKWEPWAQAIEPESVQWFDDWRHCRGTLLSIAKVGFASNLPFEFQRQIDSQMRAVNLTGTYKPSPLAYGHITRYAHDMGYAPHNVLLVTANRFFGDLEHGEEVGLQTCCINREGKPGTVPSVIELAELLRMGQWHDELALPDWRRWAKAE